jgi:imidazolonepropionase-like amidohydrolase
MSDEQLTYEQLQNQGWIIRWHSEIPSGHAYRLTMTLRDENGQAAHTAQGLGSTEEEAIAGAVAEANGWLHEQKRTGVIPPGS